MKIIKRYANRKLYDTERSSYVTLEEIAQLVKEGVEFSIIDNKTKRDITSLTLAQILCEEEKRQSHGLPLQALRGLIRTGEDFFLRKVRAPLVEMRGKTQETVERIIGRSTDEESGSPAGPEPSAPMDAPPEPPEPGALPSELPAPEEPKSGSREPGELKPGLRELFEQLQHTLDDSLHAVDDQVRRLLDGMTHLPQVQQDLVALRETVSGLERRVARLEAELAGPPGKADEGDQKSMPSRAE